MTTTTTTYTRPAAFDMFDLDAIPAEHRDRVADMIPSPVLAPVDEGRTSGYVTRTIDGLRCLDAFAVASDAEQNIILSGPTGAAKTMAFRAFAAVHRVPFAAINMNGGVDPNTFWGVTHTDIDSNADWTWTWTDAALVMMYGGVLLLDEVNMAHPRITAAFHSLLDDSWRFTVAERGITLHRHPASFVAAALNPGYTGTATLNQAFRRRFDHPITWGYEADVESVLVPSESLLELARNLRELPEVRTDVSTAALCSFVRLADVAGVEYAAARFIDGFDPAERGGVARAIELHRDRIASELSAA